MSGNTALSSILPLLAATLQTGCMTSSPGEFCRAEGVQFLSVTAEEGDVCALFQSKFAEALAKDGDSADGADGWIIAIDIEKSGTINADVARMTSSGAKSYPTVSVDVMDRPLNLTDVEQLALSAARVIRTEDARTASATQ